MKMRAKLWMLAILMLSAWLASGCAPTGGVAVETPTPTPPVSGLANPAAVYCEEKGYDYEIRTAEDGSQSGVCITPDGDECDGWAFYRGTCSFGGRAEVASGPVVTATRRAPPPPIASNCPKGWQAYVNTDAGFMFCYPAAWTLHEDAGGHEVAGGEAARSITLKRDTFRLTMQYKHTAEATVLGPGGLPAGQIEERGRVTFLGQALPLQVLTFEGKDKAVFCGARLPELEFYVHLDDDPGQGVDYATIDIPDDVQAEMRRILETFARVTSEAGGNLGIKSPDPAVPDD